VTVVQPDAIRRKVAAWLKDDDDRADAIALLAAPEWPGDPVLVIGGTRLRVVPCPTPLAARAALHDRAESEKLVLLTELTDAELGDGLLAHFSKHTVRGVNAWELVQQMFGGVALDSSLPRVGGWVAAALLDHTPVAGWPAPPGSVLTRDHALRSLAGAVLGLPRDELDISGLLQWTIDVPAQMRFSALASDVANGLVTYLVETAGQAAVPIMAAVRAGHGVDTIAMGLLAGVLWPRTNGGDVPVEVAVARTRLEPRFGGIRLTPAQAAAFQDAAEAWVDRTVDSADDRRQGLRMLRRAEAIAGEIDIVNRLGSSTLLPSGFAQRLRAFAAAIREVLPAAGLASANGVARAQAALAFVQAHRAVEPRRLETARMALRLLRWLTTVDGPSPKNLLDAVDRQVRTDGWVDRARLDLFAGDVDPVVAGAYQTLYRAVEDRRGRHDEEFADLLAAATAADVEPGRLLRVEDVLANVVEPIIRAGRRVLLLVMDGMSVAAATEFGEALTRSGAWLELTRDGGPRTGVLAALPTVTEVSRFSLLSGRIGIGAADAEQVAFTARFPRGVLLHKGDLRAGSGAAVDRDVRAALEDADNPVVAAVINTIDDALDRSDPGTAVWDERTIPAVLDLLATAQDRVVVLVSDHGHVVDRGPEAVARHSDSSENRWRPATTPAGPGEVAVSGPRVALGHGKVVLPWREEIRYGPRKAGYHGGAAPAEAVIPLLVLTAGDEEALPGWAAAPIASPEWWREPLAGADSPAPAVPVRPRRSRPVPTPQPEVLFDLLPATADATPAAPPPALTKALLASERYAQRRGTRAPLPDDRVAALLDALIAGGGRATLEALAAHADVPAHRIHGTVTALRKLLQVEGYPVLTMDPDGETVVLDRSLLIEQFGLEQP
jgi:hypothetical protein